MTQCCFHSNLRCVVCVFVISSLCDLFSRWCHWSSWIIRIWLTCKMCKRWWRKLCAILLKNQNADNIVDCYAMCECWVWGRSMNGMTEVYPLVLSNSNIYIERGTMYWWCEENKHFFSSRSHISRPQLAWSYMLCSHCVARSFCVSLFWLILNFQSQQHCIYAGRRESIELIHENIETAALSHLMT